MTHGVSRISRKLTRCSVCDILPATLATAKTEIEIDENVENKNELHKNELQHFLKQLFQELDL